MPARRGICARSLDAGAPALAPASQGSADDPFGVARGTSPNCGPDERTKQAVTLGSSADFAAFLREHGEALSQWIRFDGFRDATGGVDSTRVAAATKTSTLGSRTVFEIELGPRECRGFAFRMTIDGYTSLYGCCGI